MPTKEEMKKAIGDRIRQLRGTETLSAFAARLGTSSGRISELETGVSAPSAEFLAHLHSTLSVDLNWLLTGKASEKAVALAAPAPLPRDEADLLTLYRASSAAGKNAIKATSLAVEKSPTAVMPTTRKRTR